MSRFVDVYAPPCMRVLEKPVVAAPRWNTSIAVTAGGNEQANQNWSNPLWSFTLPEAVREQSGFEEVLAFWLAMGGPYQTFPWRNPLDFASRGLDRPNTAPTVALDDQALGVGDGFTDSFQLVKAYTYGARTYSRTVHLPILDSVLIGVDGVLQVGGYSVSRPGGVVTFDVPPDDGAVLSAGFLFDIEARFADDKAFQGVVRGRKWAGFTDVNLEETRAC